ncbi:MAG: hypothetical protein DVB25_04540 [Verrucomicrobia bacterium]|nr:MAG: hypothetical protein DVB25_04540 [Verrucomicrobiota bacterium]
MQHRSAICLALGLVVMAGCREKPVVRVTETRAVSSRDGAVRLFASSDERFGYTRRSPVVGNPPPGWTVAPANEFRLLNYRCGEGGSGEVWVSIASGTLADNVNRWLTQFGAQSLDEAGIQALRRLAILGGSGVWVQAEGQYAGGMGAAPKPGYGLAGVICEFEGQILTVKMVAPAAEVRAAIPALEAFIKSLHPLAAAE